MKPLHTVGLVVVFSMGTSLVMALTLNNPTGSEAETLVKLNSRIDGLDLSLERMADQNYKLAEMFRQTQRQVQENPKGRTRQPVFDPEVVVGDWLRKNRPDLLPPADPGTVITGAAQVKVARATRLLAPLDKPGVDDAEWNQIWKKISQAGVMDQALAILEARVAETPNDAAAHFELAGGYFGKSVNTGNGIEKGKWALKADGVLNRVLEIDPLHWEARFTKAVSLTFYPPAMGKQREAIKHFEVLRKQQRQLAPTKKHAQTYLYLGNLYAQLGKHKEANRIWNEGLRFVPDDAELRQQLNNSKD